jgi:hypothetical protein
MAEEDEPMLRPDGHRYEAPDPPETRRSRAVDVAVLGLVVVVLLLLIATGKVPIFG